MFAVPENPGAISIGVFDAEGRLVRMLAESAAETDFGIGLNGLIVEWDGKSDAGADVPPGTYHVRGVVLPPPAVEEVRFHFNDWMETAGAEMNIASIGRIRAGENGTVFVAAERTDGSGMVFAWNAEKGLLWIRDCEAAMPAGLAAGGGWVAFFEAGALVLLSASDGKPRVGDAVRNGAGPLAFHDGRLLLIEDGALVALAPDDGSETGRRPLPEGVNFSRIDGGPSGLLGVSDSKLWVWKDGTWERIAVEQDLPLQDAAWAGADRFWGIVGNPGEDAQALGLFAADGRFLSRVDLDPFGAPRNVSGTADGAAVYVLCVSDAPARETLVGMETSGESAGSAESDAAPWKIFLRIGHRRSVEISDLPETERRIRFPLDDPLNRSAGEIEIETAVHNGEVVLQTPEGLRVWAVSKAPASAASALRETGAGAATVLVGHPSFVEEFSVSGLDRMTLLDVGEVEWPGNERPASEP